MQLTEEWGEVLFSALKRAGGTAFSNMAVGYNNVDVEAANRNGIAVGNTPVSSAALCFLISRLSYWMVIYLHTYTCTGRSDGDDGGAGRVSVAGGGAEDRGGRSVHEGWPLRRMAPAPVSLSLSLFTFTTAAS